MIQSPNLKSTRVLIMLSLIQIPIEFFYKLPLPMHTLKKMAVLVITEKVSGEILLTSKLSPR